MCTRGRRHDDVNNDMVVALERASEDGRVVDMEGVMGTRHRTGEIITRELNRQKPGTDGQSTNERLSTLYGVRPKGSVWAPAVLPVHAELTLFQGRDGARQFDIRLHIIATRPSPKLSRCGVAAHPKVPTAANMVTLTNYLPSHRAIDSPLICFQAPTNLVQQRQPAFDRSCFKETDIPASPF